MPRLTNEQIAMLGDAGGLLGFHADACSAFEIELLADVAARLSRGGRETPITVEEIVACQTAVDAMRKAHDQARGL